MIDTQEQALAEARKKADLRPLPLGQSGTSKDVQYYEFECSQCGKTNRNTYCAPICTEMLEWLLCFNCHYWRDFEEKNSPRLMTIIAGRVYSPGDRTEGHFLGMAGRRFDIEYVEPSAYAGQRCTTFDLWAGSQIPKRLRSKFPDTARFMGNAEKSVVGETTCWNGSDNKNPIFPSPSRLKTAFADAEKREGK